MYVSSKHHIGKRAGLKNRGYFDIEDDYEDFEGVITSDMQMGSARMIDNKAKNTPARRTRPQRTRFMEYELG